MQYSLISTTWHDNKEKLSEVRRKVFIEEQHVPEDLEWDEFDEISYHVLAVDNQDTPIACGRLKPDGQIGRMAVMPDCRNKGIGTAILISILEHAKQSGFKELFLHAQTSAIYFYQRHDFKIVSEEFMDAGIPHKTMKIQLD